MKNLILGMIFIFNVLSVAYGQVTIKMDSDSGDWVGAGTSYDLSDATGTFNTSFSDSRLNISYRSTEDNFSFDFESPNNRDFVRGAFLDAQRTPFRGPLNPGISVTGNGRGCNTNSGEFYIYEYDISGEEPVVALDFVQYCDSQTSALRGSIRVNSNVETPYNLPFAIVDAKNSAMEGTTVQLKGGKSLSGTGTIQSYQWAHVSGPVPTFNDSTSASAVVTLPIDVSLGGDDVIVSLTVTNDANQSDTAQSTILVASKSDPKSYFTMSSESGDYIGAGRDWSFDDTNSTIQASRNFDNGVSVSINGETHYSADFAAPGDEELTIGLFDPATRYPFQDSNIAGLSVSGDGRGCNQSFGLFNVLDVKWLDNKPTSFHATFEQHCESTSAPLLSGTVAYNAIDPSVPTADAGSDITVNENELINLNGSGSIDNEGELSSYIWTFSDDSIVLNDANTSRPHFTVPLLGDMVETAQLSVQLLVVDGEGYKAQDSMTMTILQNNVAPVAQDDTISAISGEVTTIMPLINDSDSDGEILIDTIEIQQGPTNGSHIVNAQGEITYTHSGENTDSDSISYIIIDNDGAMSNVATININVSLANVAPVALNDSGSLFVGESITISVLDNDQDSDGELAVSSITIVTEPTNGTVSVSDEGTLIYSHTGASAGTDSFSYTVIDDKGGVSNEAMVSIDIKSQPVEPKPAPEPTAPSSGGGSLNAFLMLLCFVGLYRRRING